MTPKKGGGAMNVSRIKSEQFTNPKYYMNGKAVQRSKLAGLAQFLYDL